MSWISASSLQTGSNINTQAQSSISCCSSPFKSQFDISSTSLHYQETRDVLLTKDTFEKFGIKINRICEVRNGSCLFLITFTLLELLHFDDCQ